MIPRHVQPPQPQWGAKVDFTELRDAYGARADFAERCEDREAAEAASQALTAGRFADADRITGHALGRCPVWAQLHLWRGAALVSLGRRGEAETHKRWFLGITQSVLDSGDGKTPDTPYVAISIAEEYAVLLRLGLTRREQTLIEAPILLDCITAVDAEGNAVALYFNPAWHFVRLATQVKGEK